MEKSKKRDKLAGFWVNKEEDEELERMAYENRKSKAKYLRELFLEDVKKNKAKKRKEGK